MWSFDVRKKDDQYLGKIPPINAGGKIVRGYRIQYAKFSLKFNAVGWITFIYDEITEPV